MSVLCNGGDQPDRARMGGKAWALAALGSDFPVPSWFVVSPDAFTANGLTHTAAQEIKNHLLTLGDGPFAVRSSAVDEDGSESSFAGQLESFLQVPPKDVLSKIAEVRDSAFRESVLVYRSTRGYDGPPATPAVLIQQMIQPESAGVAFSRDPLDPGASHVVISATAGLAERLVAGEVEGDEYRVDRNGDGVSATVQGPSAVLTDKEAISVAELALKAEQHFGAPQDIEWAIQDSKLYIVQSRPITTLPSGTRTVWDNSNIVESYSGVTSPLTFSFARYVYAEVYRAFCSIMGVSPEQIERNRWVFDNMLGRIQGHVYYNLLNWYRALALFPGFKANRAFMEQMMGVGEPLPAEVLAEIAPERPSAWGRLADNLSLGRTLLRLILHATVLRWTVRTFYARVNSALDENSTPLAGMDLQELAIHYRFLEDELLAKWDAPLINDFLCMIAFGLSRKVLCRWLGEETGGALHNQFMIGQGDIVSAEPAQRIKAMAGKVRVIPGLADALLTDGAPALTPHRGLEAEFSTYIAKFGDRCAQELKLESVTLDEDPTPLLQAIAFAANREEDCGQGDATGQDLSVGEAFAGRPVRRLIASALLGWAKDRVRDRENLRFERTRVFGRVRKIFLSMGRQLAGANLLAQPRDIFSLEIAEVLGAVDGTATTTDLKALVDVRQKEAAAFTEADEPPPRFETFGAVALDLARRPLAGATKPIDGDGFQGLGCCHGVVRARVRVVRDPRTESLKAAEILVARHTDPGWIALFSSAAGILVERGSLLSHSAIVAREMNIPAVVSLHGLLEWLETGDLVEMDGASGQVVKIETRSDDL